jgi:plastocyanin
VTLRTALAAACASGVLLGLGAGALAAAQPVTHTVVIEGLKFVPETITVKRGDTVVWVNKDPYPHTATAKGVFDSGSIAEGKSWKYTARRAGEHSYICTFHPNMKAVLRVE